jgi:hypothetical protein
VRIDPAPRDIGRLVDDALLLYRANFKTLILSSLAVLFPVLLLAGVAGGAYYSSFLEYFAADLVSVAGGSYAQPPEAVGVMLAFQALLYLTVPLRFIALVWISSSVFRSTPDLMADGRPGIKDFLAAGRHRALQLGLVQLLVYLISQAAYAVVAVGLVLAAFVALALLAGAGVLGALLAVILLALLGLAAFALYMLALSRFQVWGPAVVLEPQGVGGSLSRSMSLTRGMAWRTVWYWMTVWMVGYAFRAAVYAPALVLFTNAVLPFIQEPGAATLAVPLWVTMALGVSAAVAEAFVVPFERACWSQYYLDLRSRSEGMDLVIRAREAAAVGG